MSAAAAFEDLELGQAVGFVLDSMGMIRAGEVVELNSDLVTVEEYQHVGNSGNHRFTLFRDDWHIGAVTILARDEATR